MTGISMMLKALGVKIEDEDIRKLEMLLPQVPERLHQMVTVVNSLITNTHARLSALETQQQALTQMLTGIQETQKLIAADVAQLLERGLEHGRTDSNNDGRSNGAKSTGVVRRRTTAN